ncbi:MAG: ClbS/DfsB family four-helix bundle protein [Anaerolineae bacterium]
MNRDQLLGRVERAWEDLQASYAGLEDAQLLVPGVAGAWSVRDLLVHVTIWEQEALRWLPVIQGGGRADLYRQRYGGIDAFNAQMIEARRALTLDEVRAEHAATHARLVAMMAAAPEELYATETRYRRRVRWDTYGHYGHHAERIRAWREREGL